ncbi:MAG: phenylacetate--CoA ligase [Clostridia bacterium]|nr:phenylacetate--CoA ligase [Clostridia bacterium]
MDLIWNKAAETMKRADIEKLQLERLQHIVKYCYENVPFYTKKLDEAGVKPEMIKTLEDIKLIPLTTKEDLRDNYPFGMLAVPQNKIVRIHASSGTTGNPTVVGYTQKDIDVWAEDMARLVYAVGANSDTVVQICFGYGLFTGALGLHYGLEKVGASVIPASSGNTEKQLKLMRDFGTNCLVSTPSYALYLAEKSKELGFSMDEYKIRLGLLGSEGTTPEMRDQIEAAWGMFVTDNYGMSEIGGPGMSGECMERNGLHINEDHFLCEIINSQTLEVLGEGEVGEMVVTTLTKEGMPLLRYRTKDITRITYEPCRCGRTTARMDKIKGRSDDMLKIRGVNVFPSQVESVLIGLDDIAPHYQLIVRREGFQDTLEVKVELLENVPLEKFSALEKIQRTVESKLQTVLGIKAKVTLAEPKSLERFQGKAKRILDLRNQ